METRAQEVQAALDLLTKSGLAESIRKEDGSIVYRLVWPIDGKMAEELQTSVNKRWERLTANY
jgi:hypothetical protein